MSSSLCSWRGIWEAKHSAYYMPSSILDAGVTKTKQINMKIHHMSGGDEYQGEVKQGHSFLATQCPWCSANPWSMFPFQVLWCSLCLEWLSFPWLKTSLPLGLGSKISFSIKHCLSMLFKTAVFPQYTHILAFFTSPSSPITFHCSEKPMLCAAWLPTALLRPEKPGCGLGKTLVLLSFTSHQQGYHSNSKECEWLQFSLPSPHSCPTQPSPTHDKVMLWKATGEKTNRKLRLKQMRRKWF